MIFRRLLAYWERLEDAYAKVMEDHWQWCKKHPETAQFMELQRGSDGTFGPGSSWPL